MVSASSRLPTAEPSSAPTLRSDDDAGWDGGGEGALMLTMSRVNPMQSPSASDMGEEPEVRPHAPCPHGSGWAGLCGH